MLFNLLTDNATSIAEILKKIHVIEQKLINHLKILKHAVSDS